MNRLARNALILWSATSFIGLSTYFGYAAVSGIWTDTSTLESSSGATLSSTAWNKILGNLQQLKDASVAPGTIASVKMLQTRAQATYTTSTSGNGVDITPLNITITPKKAGNMVILEWVMHGEVYNDNVFLVKRNGVLLPDATNAGNNRWAGITTPDYEADENSTPMTKTIRIADMNSLDTASTYTLAIRSSGVTAYTVALNRTVGSAGSDHYEAGLSSVTATEVYQ